MNQVKNWKIVSLVFLLSHVLFSQQTFRVPDEYPTIQSAVDQAGPDDIIEILDDGEYEEQVTIDSTKDGLTIRGNPLNKPTIIWKDTKAVHPVTLEEARDAEASMEFESKGIYYDQNGALRILKAKRVTIENIIVDGEEAYCYRNENVWYDSTKSAYYDLVHGNTAIVLWLAGDAVIRNCEVRNAYFGIYVKDRNERGIFADPNPADIQLKNIIPLSGFGKTGNHLFEHNRIRNNSWGMFFESAWDLGSTIRYNLIFSNYHQSNTITNEIDSWGGTEGPNQTGGAIMFKDVPISPVAIYNNTFWDNTINVSCHWQAGAYSLIFNNIFSEPHEYWNDFRDNSDFNDLNLFSLEKIFKDRYKHNLYAAQVQKLDIDSIQYYVAITNDMVELESGSNNTMSHGAKILGGNDWSFPQDAENYWFEVSFKSTEPDDPEFLVPDWDDQMVVDYVVDKGWPEGGIRDSDGSIADIGAIPFSGIPEEKILVKPVEPVIITGDKAVLSFNVYSAKGSLENLKVKYIQWMSDLPKDDEWAFQLNKGDVLNYNLPAKIQKLSAPSNTIKMGLNSLTIENINQDGMYAFMELVLEGTDSEGNTVTSNVGFLPFRELKYKFTIKLYPPDAAISPENEITSVQVGQPVKLHVFPYKADGSKISEGFVQDVALNLVSGQTFRTSDNPQTDIREIVLSEVSITTGEEITVIFTDIPSSGSGEIISGSGIYYHHGDSAGFVIRGTSDEIKILPGPPAQVKFLEQSRNSQYPSLINPGEILKTKLQVFDKYGNKAIEPAEIVIKSLKPVIGGPQGATSGISDDTGVVYIDSIMVNNGTENDIFELVAVLWYGGDSLDTDTAYLKVGKVTDRFMIFYSDTIAYDPTVVFGDNICSSERVPVTIRALNGDVLLKERNKEFVIEFYLEEEKVQLLAYDSETALEPINQSALVNGEKIIWIQPKLLETKQGTIIENGEIRVTYVSDRTILPGRRDGIKFV
ncbi:MAG: hypothetical protein GXY77_00670, partial [Fibrobacter sp.]|nr:hypothetical protein [Fibrobacter sp.]